MRISYPIASILSGIAEKKALSMAVPMAIAITDAEGHLIHFGRMDDTLPASTELAASKAYTAAVFRMSTQKVGELSQPGEMLYGVEHSMAGNVALFGGGLPLRIDEKVVGAIGISGGTVQEDIMVAEVVREALVKMGSWHRVLSPMPPPQTEGKECAKKLRCKLEETLDHLPYEKDPGLSFVLTGAVFLSYA